MPMDSISNRKLYCYFILLILSIFVILASSFYFLNKANHLKQEVESELARAGGNFTKDAEQRMNTNDKLSSPDLQNKTESTITIPIANSISPLGETSPPAGDIQAPKANNSQNVDCNQFALQNNLTLANEDSTGPIKVQCPESFRPKRCRVCPRLCISQQMNCDKKKFHCPDGQDEEECQDTSGAYLTMIRDVQQAALANRSTVFHIPQSCSSVEFNQERCPCVFNETKVVFCEHHGETRVPIERIAPTVFKIRMSNNSIRNIDGVQWTSPLSTLVLDKNLIARIGPNAFGSAPSLKLLFLGNNKIAYFDLDALAGLSRLTLLDLEYNSLDTFDSKSLIHAPSLRKLYLGDNVIDLPSWTKFSESGKNLTQLLLDNNRITKIRAAWFSNMNYLEWLSLSHNEISFIESFSFDGDPALKELNLSHNKIKMIGAAIFATNSHIQRLLLGHNEFTSLPGDAFRHLQQLESLNLTGIQFDQVDKETFAHLKLRFIYFEKFRYCHFASHATVCLPLTDGISSNNELLIFPILKYAVIVVASICCLGNLIVFVWRSVSPNEHYTLSLFVRNLSIADLMMGFYLAAIGYKDQAAIMKPGEMLDWMSSGTCATIGFIAILSSELSSFIIIIITIERFRSITTTKILQEEEQKYRARIYLATAWVASLTIASYPILERLFFQTLFPAKDGYSDYYATNGLCLPLHIDQPYLAGWLYSATVYLGINLVAVITVILLYALMYVRIMRAKQQAFPYGARKREDVILATRFFFIVMTDCVCWVPIVVIKIMALSKVSIPSSIYGLLVVFIIPINAALNPIIYTVAAPTSLRATICKWFTRAYERINQLAARTASSSSRYSSHSSSSSSAESATLANMIDAMRFARKNTDSTNSVTIDTYDTSITTSKPSVESALINYESICGPTNSGGSNGALKAAPLTFDLSKPKTSQPSNEEEEEEEKGPLYRRRILDLGSAVKSENSALGSLNLECSKSTNPSGNKQQVQPANTDKLTGKLAGRNRRRRQHASAAATAALKQSYCNCNSNSCANFGAGCTDTSGDSAKSRLSTSQADYLSTYENNAADNGAIGATSLKDKTTCGSQVEDSLAAGLRQQQQQYRRLIRMVNNNSANSLAQPHHVLVVQARPNGNSASGLIKSVDPLQVDAGSLSGRPETDCFEAGHCSPEGSRRSTRIIQTPETDDITDGDSTISLDKLVSFGPANERSARPGAPDKSPSATANQSSRVSFSSKDSRTCLLSGTDRL